MLKDKLKAILKEELNMYLYYSYDLVDEYLINNLRELSKRYGEKDVAEHCKELDGEYLHLTIYLAISGNKETEQYLKNSIKKHFDDEREIFLSALGLSHINIENKMKVFKELNLDFNKYKEIRINKLKGKYKELISSNSLLSHIETIIIPLRSALMSALSYYKHISIKDFINYLKYLSDEYGDKEVAKICSEINNDIPSFKYKALFGYNETHILLKYLAIAGNYETEKYLELSIQNNKAILDSAIGLIALNNSKGLKIVEDNLRGFPKTVALPYMDSPIANKLKENIKNGKYKKTYL